jgi:hypothetical protein
MDITINLSGFCTDNHNIIVRPRNRTGQYCNERYELVMVGDFDVVYSINDRTVTYAADDRSWEDALGKVLALSVRIHREPVLIVRDIPDGPERDVIKRISGYHRIRIYLENADDRNDDDSDSSDDDDLYVTNDQIDARHPDLLHESVVIAKPSPPPVKVPTIDDILDIEVINIEGLFGYYKLIDYGVVSYIHENAESLLIVGKLNTDHVCVPLTDEEEGLWMAVKYMIVEANSKIATDIMGRTIE